MADFKPNTPYNVQAKLQVPVCKTVKGVKSKQYETEEDIFISFRTFGGTETVSNGMAAVENTAVVETWYRPDIKADCRLMIGGTLYEIMGTPENINMRNQFLKFKVRAVKGSG